MALSLAVLRGLDEAIQFPVEGCCLATATLGPMPRLPTRVGSELNSNGHEVLQPRQLVLNKFLSCLLTTDTCFSLLNGTALALVVQCTPSASTDILGWVIHCWGNGRACPQYRMFKTSLASLPLDVSRSLSSVGQPGCLWTNVSQGAQSSL